MAKKQILNIKNYPRLLLIVYFIYICTLPGLLEFGFTTYPINQ
jgi:hypothetical protein